MICQLVINYDADGIKIYNENNVVMTNWFYN